MKGNKSVFLESNKEKLKKLIEDLSKDFKYVSVLGTDSIGIRYQVSRSSSAVSDSMFSERGFVLRVFNGINYSEYSFNSLADINEIKNRIKKIAIDDVNVLKNQDLSLMDFPLIEEDPISDNFCSEYEIDPFKISAEEKISKLTELRDFGLSLNENIIDFRINYEEIKVQKIFLSKNKNLSQSILFTTIGLVGIGRKDGNIRYDYEPLSGLMGFEIVEQAKEVVKEVVDKVVDLFNAERIKPGTYEIICDPSISGLIAHEAFGHGVEMDMFVKNRAKGAEYMNKDVASSLVKMHDGSKSAEQVGTYLFDDEGTLGTDTVIIEKGILKSGISDLLSALKLGTKPTGNGRRESFERKAYARMTNTFFENGNDSLEDMIRSIKKGYLLEGFFSGMEDPKNWGIQCVLAKAKEIVDGKLTGKIFSPITLTGYVPDLLKSISMVSKDEISLSGSGYCGKGYKEYVKTSTGGSYIKAIGRLS